MRLKKYFYGNHQYENTRNYCELLLFFGRQGNFRKVSMLSLKNDLWQIIENPWNWNIVQLISSCKFVNGKLHLATNVGSGLERFWGKTSFNLADNKWGKLERPCGDGVSSRN
ncbi:hypothetical protein H5410_001598 [Solanum commersonii]|uniref:Uncharacterized protein n=1 Tax=Solanum commersonii TaxID=4109 RepID=A0A9J6AZM7_SOLCO|nr:hypothetical protein H5410_001598 [Solanum commersonii]